MTEIEHFGAFASIWTGQTPRHLVLLDLLDEKGAELAIQMLSDIIAQEHSAQDDLQVLLADRNWRPQLVGATALAFGWGSASHWDEAWRQLEMGTWVSPQLVVALSRVDPKFKERAHVLLERLVSSGTPAGFSIKGHIGLRSWASRHSERGPGGTRQERAKTISALLAILGPGDQWVAGNVGRMELQELLASDADDGGKIAATWAARLVALKSKLA
jgi:hypothetical protein